jgi:protein-tyrosine phosphatase
MRILTENFANIRGLIRTVLANFFWFFGPYRKYGKVDWSKVDRMVFVCQGNICRSPFAYYLAAKLSPHSSVASFGTSTTSGLGANDRAVDVARDFGVDLSGHQTTNISAFSIESGDLLIVMEDRHIFQLENQISGKKVQVCLLGLWCHPKFALLYDPFEHGRDYFSVCFKRIEASVSNLLDEYNHSLKGR